MDQGLPEFLLTLLLDFMSWIHRRTGIFVLLCYPGAEDAPRNVDFTRAAGMRIAPGTLLFQLVSLCSGLLLFYYYCLYTRTTDLPTLFIFAVLTTVSLESQ